MLDKNINCQQTSSMGRFFDAAAAIAGIRADITYEGEAAIMLEYYASNFLKQNNVGSSDKDVSSYEVVISQQDSGFVVETDSIISSLIDDIVDKKPIGFVAAKFHKTVADMVLKGCIRIRQTTALDRVCLSGGVFQNITLLELCIDLLEAYGFSVFVHSDVPTNDGGIALGQAVMAIAALDDKIDIV